VVLIKKNVSFEVLKKSNLGQKYTTAPIKGNDGIISIRF